MRFRINSLIVLIFLAYAPISLADQLICLATINGKSIVNEQTVVPNSSGVPVNVLNGTKSGLQTMCNALNQSSCSMSCYDYNPYTIGQIPIITQPANPNHYQFSAIETSGAVITGDAQNTFAAALSSLTTNLSDTRSACVTSNYQNLLNRNEGSSSGSSTNCDITVTGKYCQYLGGIAGFPGRLLNSDGTFTTTLFPY